MQHWASCAVLTVCGNVCMQGHILMQFSPANKCEVAPMEHVHEYTPEVTKNAKASTAVPVCASLSMEPGDRITVMQVGTVGVVESADQDSQGIHIRTIVQHAVLVLLTPADGGSQRSEVLTGKQLCQGQYMVAWLHSGRPTMDPRKVHYFVCRDQYFI